MGKCFDWIFARLARVTSGGQLVREIDGLRFIAITAVVVDHFDIYLTKMVPYNMSVFGNGFWEWLFHNGGAKGVQLFFAISGFVLALPFAQHYLLKTPAPKLKRYFARRLTRLEPPYILNLIIMTALKIAVLHGTFRLALPHLLASIGYVHNIAYQGISTINPVAWSLEVEVQFYILAPLLAKVYMLQGKNLRRLVIIGAGLALAIGQRVIPLDCWFMDHFKWSIVFMMQYFLVGFLLVDIYLVDWKRAPEKGVMWDIISGICWLAIIPVLRYDVFVGAALPALIALAYIGAFRGKVLNWVMTTRWFVTFGGMCYTIYLYHALIAHALMSKLLHLPRTGLVVIDVPIIAVVGYLPILVICSVMFLLIEKPCMRPDWPQRLKAFVTRRPLESAPRA